MTEPGLEPRAPLPGQQTFGAERARVERNRRPSRAGTPSRLWGLRPRGHRTWARPGGLTPSRTPAPCPAPSWSAQATASDRPEPLPQHLPVLPGARPPVTPTARATARRSSSAPRGEARTVAMSGPGGPELRDARTQPGRRRTRKGSAPGRWTSRDWLRRAQAPPLGRE